MGWQGASGLGARAREGTDHGHFDIFDFVGGDVFGEKFEGADVAWADSLDLAGTKPSLRTFETLSFKSGNIRNVYKSVSNRFPTTLTGTRESGAEEEEERGNTIHEDRWIRMSRIVSHSLQIIKESIIEHVTTILPVGNGFISQITLHLDNSQDLGVFNLFQFFC
jgi:hypothetical protein